LKITIDNHDGLGAIDYTSALADSAALKLIRRLNQPTQCSFTVDCNASALAIPVKYGRVTVASDAGIVMFTGYVVQVPASVFQGEGVAGSLYAESVSAVSDEVLLDQQSVPVTSGSTGLRMVQAMQALTQRVDPVRLTVLPDSTTNIIGHFAADAAESWSANAGVLASVARAGYRSLSGQLMLQQVGAVTHMLDGGAGTLDPASLTLVQAAELVNDVTVCGESEPQAYVTDVFQGDGTTTSFELTRRLMSVPAVLRALVADSFNEPAINPMVWQISDPGSRFTLAAAGLAVNGGNGLDGQTTLSTIDNTEMGGALVLTAGGVQASAGSDGYIACFYNGNILLVNLFAGFHVKQSGGDTVVVPVVNGVEAGATATLMAGHAYSFRLRYYSREMQRVLGSYYVTGVAGQQAFGGGSIASAADLVFEVQDTTGGLNQPTVVLYDGSASASPGTCVLTAVNSPAFTGSVQSISLEQTGSAWVTSLQTAGSPFTRRIGLATIGADCKLTSTGKLDFYATSVPQNGEMVTATYRTTGVAVARLFNAASVAAEATAVSPGVSRWIGSVTKPSARSSADCENAALALLAISTNASAGLAGKYIAQNLQQTSDVWPGDLLAIESGPLGANASVIVRSVTLTTAAAVPELVTYVMEFANDWAEDLSVKTTKTVPKTVWLPQAALAAPTALSNLNTLSVNVTASEITVSAGASAPPGGGFEVRRIDWNFGTGSDGTLVLRSPVPNFTILREAAIEQYFVRMYDGSTPPNYSRFSSEICVTVPL
jgi:hypothetical protein